MSRKKDGREVGMISLGCPKNLVDSERMLGLLEKAGYQITNDPNQADILMVNTCSFIEPARQESKQALEEMLEYKRSGRCRIVVAAGCLPQRYGEQVLGEFPELDALVGINDFPRIVEIIGKCLDRDRQSPVVALAGADYLYRDNTPRLRATPPWTAYVKLAEGCDHRCRFCAVPAIRGRFRSRSLASVVREVRDLASQGVREINLIAQDTTRYGRDRYGRPRLADLLRRLVEVEEIRWFRLLYCYPSRVDDELIGLIADHPNICNYLDLPLQHSHPQILKKMGRPGSGDSHLRLIEKIRNRIPDIAIRTSLIVGFPGEGEREFRHLLRFMRQAEFDRAGVFQYSREEGTPAARDPGQVPADLREERYRRAMALQREISGKRNQAWVGRELEVLVEAQAKWPLSDQKRSRRQVWMGRSYRDAPEVDGLVFVRQGKGGVGPGDFVFARITRALDYDLEGEVVS